MAPPRKQIDLEQLKKLASINCSYEEMASILNVDPSTLTRQYAQVIKEGRDLGRMSLKRKQFEVAMSGNVTMLIWLGKIMLHQIEPKEAWDENQANAELHKIPTAKLLEFVRPTGK